MKVGAVIGWTDISVVRTLALAEDLDLVFQHPTVAHRGLYLQLQGI